jgi:EmrB/QacA subfamily drug resistance transporter
MNWTKQQLSILIIISLSSFIGTFLISSINIALPAIEKTYQIDAVSLSWIITSFLLSTALFLLPAGRWGDIFGNGRIYKLGLILFTVSSVFCLFSPSASWLIAARFLQGIGAAFTNTTGQAILVASFPPQKRGQVIGISVSSVYLGLSLGPFLGGMLTEIYSWQSIFLLSSILGFLSYVIAEKYLDKDNVPDKNERKKANQQGIFFFMIGLSALVYGSSQIPSLKGWIILFSGVLLLVLFWLIEIKSTNPFINLKLYTKNRMFAYSNLAALINYSATAAIVFFLSLYLQKIKALSPQSAGLILMVQPLVMTVFSPITGHLSDKIQPRFLATAGMAICSIGLAVLAFLGAFTPIWVVVLTLIWLGFGFALFSSPNMNIIMGSVQRNQYGQASGSASFMRILGQMFSMTLVTFLFASSFNHLPVDEIPNELFIDTMQVGFLVFTAIGVSGIYFSVVRGNVKR